MLRRKIKSDKTWEKNERKKNKSVHFINASLAISQNLELPFLLNSFFRLAKPTGFTTAPDPRTTTRTTLSITPSSST
jgi:hypothetical protein